ncbi:hypothetical protein [Arcobacter sp.]|uniref:hypothetical protein n=1 Tax=unclassified Arcobacter TaxID=2593671 RepID=UPI003B00BA35
MKKNKIWETTFDEIVSIEHRIEAGKQNYYKKDLHNNSTVLRLLFQKELFYLQYKLLKFINI